MNVEEIIDCGGVYEVHPLQGSGWAVVNSETGAVRCSFPDKEHAVRIAESMNND